ncbi:Protein TRANSPARENT TESTA 9, variant 2 [Stylosanthes scabra]|uniref:Protein TRANSPARENT TESTA 9, variant 2 n=1 Tax=Stylosanthes scabra TaxID=79078 RepID=A0ABU6Z5J2_9FABA|nr:Protein TRANSPARENT TESTA 9, variant 2 [Stylosanthes scabra]
MLDGLGILPQRKQHKKLLLEALVGEASGEEQLFSPKNSLARDRFGSELEYYHEKIKEHYGVSSQPTDVGTSPLVHRFQVIDALVSLFCRSNISAETLWDGGWLLRQLLPYSESEFNSNHLELLKVSYNSCASALMEEVRGIWSDFLVTVLCEEWRKCKRENFQTVAMESSSPRKEWTCMLLPPHKFSSEVDVPDGSSFVAGERMLELVKVFVLQHQLQIFALGKALPEQPPICLPGDRSVNHRAKTSGIDVSGPKPGIELSLGDAVPCRIAFERGKERHFWFLAISVGTSGWLVLAEELPLRQTHGVIRVAAPLAGCNPKIDDKHPKWLHLRIRPSSLPFLDSAKFNDHGKSKKALIDGRWTLAFRDEESCKSAFMMIVEEMGLQSDEVHRRLKPLLNLEMATDSSSSSVCDPDDSSSFRTHTNSL